MDYGVGISNRYSYLNDDVEEDEVTMLVNKLEKPEGMMGGGNGKKEGPYKKPKTTEGVKDKGRDRSKSSSAQKANETGGKYEDNNGQQRIRRENGMNSSSRSRMGRGGGDRDHRNKENFEEGMSPRGGQGQDEDYGSVGAKDDRGHGGGYGQGQGGRGFGRNNFTRGRRDFDRLSGSEKSGVKSVDKRDGAGAHNWGSYKDEISMDADVQGNNGVDEAGNREENNPGMDCDQKQDVVGESEATVEEPKQFTLEQWKAMQQPKLAPNFNIRKANEGEDPSKWKNLVLKKKEDIVEEEITYEGTDIWYPQRVGRQKVSNAIAFHFEDEFRRRKYKNQNHVGEGDSYAGTGREKMPADRVAFDRNKGIGRGYQHGQFSTRKPKPPNVYDVKEWPSLNC